MQYTQQKNIEGVTIDDIYIGNGASELIVMSMQALLDNGDEVLVPTPIILCGQQLSRLPGGRPFITCAMRKRTGCPILRISRRRSPRIRRRLSSSTRIIRQVPCTDELLKKIVDLAREHQLIVFADEIYDKCLYDGTTHTSIASLANDVLFITMNGLSKNYRSCGYRVGWMVVSGEKKYARDYIVGLDMLSSMRLCSNVPGQFAIQTALGGYQSINDLVAPGGRG